uniref:Vesicle transport protein n=1 Tax=Parascaris equorum TaxID=6256 RepID=A0A914RYU9_PAREQ
MTGDEGACGLSRAQRIVAFFMALLGAFFCFGMAVMMLPLIVIQARKFAALNTLGSVMLILRYLFKNSIFLLNCFLRLSPMVTLEYFMQYSDVPSLFQIFLQQDLYIIG